MRLAFPRPSRWRRLACIRNRPDVMQQTVFRTCSQMANVIILAVGYNNKDVEREGADHSYTTLPGLQTNLTNAVIAAGKRACH